MGRGPFRVSLVSPVEYRYKHAGMTDSEEPAPRHYATSCIDPKAIKINHRCSNQTIGKLIGGHDPYPILRPAAGAFQQTMIRCVIL
jgi:hypothetical protein